MEYNCSGVEGIQFLWSTIPDLWALFSMREGQDLGARNADSIFPVRSDPSLFYWAADSENKWTKWGKDLLSITDKS